MNKVQIRFINLALEGEFRACHSALIAHSEEIAFYKGNRWEQKRVNETFKELVDHVNNIYEKKFFMGICDSMLVKYGAVIMGYTILGLPVFRGRGQYAAVTGGTNASTIARDYIRNSSLLINLAKVHPLKLIFRLLEELLSLTRICKVYLDIHTWSTNLTS